MLIYLQSFVTCSVGIEAVGYVLVPYGITLGVSSVASGFLSKHVPRTVLMYTGIKRELFTNYASSLNLFPIIRM